MRVLHADSVYSTCFSELRSFTLYIQLCLTWDVLAKTTDVV